MTVSERRRALLETLCERRHDTRENLAFEFGVSKRTIEYDVLELSRFYPIYTVQGNGGGIYVLEGFYLSKTRLTDKQIALLDELALTLDGEQLEVMQSIIKKFKR